MRLRLAQKPALLIMALLAAACGNSAETSEQSVETLPIPEYPKVQNDVFSLTGTKPDITYRLTMMIINEATDPALLAEVVNASVFSREAFAEARKFEVTRDFKNLYSDSGLESQAVEIMSKDLQAFELRELQKNPISIEESEQNSRAWLEKELTTLALDPGQRESFNQSWSAYCEAKIIELAANSNFAASTYKELPTPQALCNAYYETSALLQGPSCKAPVEGNFFNCLWQEGVAKTRWFKALPPLPGGASAEESAAWTASNTEMSQKQKTLQDLLKKSAAGFQKVLALDPEKVAISSNPVKNKVNPNFFVSIFTQQLKKEPGNNVAWCNVPPFGIKDRSLSAICNLFGLAPLANSPADWINAIEGLQEGGTLLSLPAPPPPRVATLQQHIRYMAERDKGGTSESDRLFHKPISSPKALDAPTFDGAGADFKAVFAEIRSNLAPVLYGSLDDEAQTEKALRFQNINYRLAKIDEVRAEMKVLEEQTEASINRGLQATNAGNVAHGFIEIRFRFKQLGQVLMGEFWLKDAEQGNQPTSLFRGCFEAQTEQSVDCPSLPADATDQLQIFPATLARDSKTGRIEFAMKVTEPEAAGLVAIPRAAISEGAPPSYFMELDANAFKGRSLSFELFPNRLREHLDILTGKVFIREGENTLYEGGISGWDLWD